MLVQRSLQPPPLPGLRVAGGHIAVALARHFESRILQRGDDVTAAAHGAVLDALRQVVADELARVGLDRQTRPQVRRVDVGAVSGLLRPGAGRVVGPAPAVLVVEAVAQRTEGLLPAGRRDVQALARLKVAAGGENVHVPAAAALAVLHGRPRVAVRLEPGPGRLLELVEDGFDLRAGRPVLRRPGDHAGGVLVLELERVGDGGHGVGIAAADLDAVAQLPGRRCSLARRHRRLPMLPAWWTAVHPRRRGSRSEPPRGRLAMTSSTSPSRWPAPRRVKPSRREKRTLSDPGGSGVRFIGPRCLRAGSLTTRAGVTQGNSEQSRGLPLRISGSWGCAYMSVIYGSWLPRISRSEIRRISIFGVFLSGS